MHSIVCIKQVPDTTEVRINPETNTLMREGVESIINPFDMYAIEESVRLKEKLGGKVTAISMGPPQAEAALKEAIGMGVDEGILVTSKTVLRARAFDASGRGGPVADASYWVGRVHDLPILSVIAEPDQL